MLTKHIYIYIYISLLTFTIPPKYDSLFLPGDCKFLCWFCVNVYYDKKRLKKDKSWRIAKLTNRKCYIKHYYTILKHYSMKASTFISGVPGMHARNLGWKTNAQLLCNHWNNTDQVWEKRSSKKDRSYEWFQNDVYPNCNSQIEILKLSFFFTLPVFPSIMLLIFSDSFYGPAFFTI